LRTVFFYGVSETVLLRVPVPLQYLLYDNNADSTSQKANQKSDRSIIDQVYNSQIAEKDANQSQGIRIHTKETRSNVDLEVQPNKDSSLPSLSP